MPLSLMMGIGPWLAQQSCLSSPCRGLPRCCPAPRGFSGGPFSRASGEHGSFKLRAGVVASTISIERKVREEGGLSGVWRQHGAGLPMSNLSLRLTMYLRDMR